VILTFKFTDSITKLPDPDGTLSKRVSSSAIKMVVLKLGRSGPGMYIKCTQW